MVPCIMDSIDRLWGGPLETAARLRRISEGGPILFTDTFAGTGTATIAMECLASAAKSRYGVEIDIKSKVPDMRAQAPFSNDTIASRVVSNRACLRTRISKIRHDV